MARLSPSTDVRYAPAADVLGYLNAGTRSVAASCASEGAATTVIHFVLMGWRPKENHLTPEAATYPNANGQAFYGGFVDYLSYVNMKETGAVASN